MNSIGLKKRTTIPYHMQTNCKAVWYNGTFVARFWYLVVVFQKDSDTYLQHIVYICSKQTQTATKTTQWDLILPRKLASADTFDKLTGPVSHLQRYVPPTKMLHQLLRRIELMNTGVSHWTCTDRWRNIQEFNKNVQLELIFKVKDCRLVELSPQYEISSDTPEKLAKADITSCYDENMNGTNNQHSIAYRNHRESRHTEHCSRGML